MENYQQPDNYQLDEAKFRQEYYKSRGCNPTDEVVLIYNSVVDMAYTAYIEGAKGQPFRLPFPIKKT